jgi:ribonuclease HII
MLAQPIRGLKDSKKLSRARRESLSIQILEEALAFGLGWVEPAEIDTMGLTEAVRLAMHRALASIPLPYDVLIIDGGYNFFPENSKATTLIKADDLIPAVSAASIIAKVARDQHMMELAIKYPKYGFEKHVGYGTAHHIAMLRQYGASDMHRLSYKPIKALGAFNR